jgi:hypothetical protein
MAKEADSPTEHAEVARQYLWRAKALETKADQIEKDLLDSKDGYNQFNQKWPAMVNSQRERKERTAVQARRAAKESMELAEHHGKLAGKSLDQLAAVRMN